jgi:hypothetical protein
MLFLDQEKSKIFETNFCVQNTQVFALHGLHEHIFLT